MPSRSIDLVMGASVRYNAKNTKASRRKSGIEECGNIETKKYTTAKQIKPLQSAPRLDL